MIHSDAAISHRDRDSLDRNRVATALADMLGDRALETPLTIGIFGGWGTGKTSLMRLLKAQIDASFDVEANRLLVLWFDAWTYAREEQSLWRALLLSITGALKDSAVELAGDEKGAAALKEKLATLETSLYRGLTLKTNERTHVNWGAAVPYAADFALRYATAGLSDLAKDPATGEGLMARLTKVLKGGEVQEVAKLIERSSQESYIDHVQSLEQFRRTFTTALELVGVGRTEPGGPSRRLYIFVDDLDRCLPEDAVAAIEAIKLFVDIPGCVFILGMDAEVVQSGIRARYARYFEKGEAPFRAADYLDKIIQLPFHLPPLDRRQVTAFLDEFAAKDPSGLIGDCRALIEIAVPDNPRTLKRVLNVLRLSAELVGCGAVPAGAQADDVRTTRRRLAKLILMQLCFPEAFVAVLAEGPALLTSLEEQARKAKEIDEHGKSLLSERLKRLLGDETATFRNMDAEALKRLLSLTRAFEAPRP